MPFRFDIPTAVRGVGWPALPNARGAALLALFAQLERSQWLPREELERRQFEQLARVATHAHETIPFYRRRFEAAELKPWLGIDRQSWSRLALLSRGEVQTAGEQLRSRSPPAEHGALSHAFTSGSTGQPVKIVKTGVTNLLWSALTLRDHAWHDRDMRGKLAAIRWMPSGEARPPDGLTAKDWGAATADVAATGASVALDIQSSPAEQAEWLARHDPDYLLIYPSAVRPLIRALEDRAARLSRLRQVCTLGETCGDEVRLACQRAWGAPVVDMYSSQEFGYLALQCPTAPRYHVQAEHVLVEVLDEQGRECLPGQRGRVVVSSLNNFAKPLFRYEIGDWAEVGEPCACGRGLPVLERVLGRERNMVLLADGGRRRASVILSDIEELSLAGAIRQFQLAQLAIDRLEMLLVADRRLSPSEEASILACVHRAVGHAMPTTIRYVDAIPRAAGGKLDDFVRLIEPPAE